MFRLANAGFDFEFVSEHTQRLGWQPTRETMWFSTKSTAANEEALKELCRAMVGMWRWWRGENQGEWTRQVELSPQNMIHRHVRNPVNSSQFNYDYEASTISLHQCRRRWLMCSHVCFFILVLVAHSEPAGTAPLITAGCYYSDLLLPDVAFDVCSAVFWGSKGHSAAMEEQTPHIQQCPIKTSFHSFSTVILIPMTLSMKVWRWMSECFVLMGGVGSFCALNS